MRVLEFVCPRCHGTILKEMPEVEAGEDESILLTCSEKEGAGCGWIGYVPRSRGVAVEER
jgi:hypothetical protein